MDDRETLLKEVFGESSDSDDYEQQYQIYDDDDQSYPTVAQNPCWEPIKEVEGLWLCREFLSPNHQSSLLSAIQNEGWFTEASHNQAMRFGNLPAWAAELSNLIREMVLCDDHVSNPADSFSCNGHEKACILSSNLLWRQPLFDQLIVNVYQPGEGICAHVDLMRFEDGIAIVSLDSSCVMHFTQVGEASNIDKEGQNGPAMAKVPLYLTPGSLVLMSGEARYLWKHEINRKPGFQIWEGKELNQQKRTSITLRKLCPSE